MRARRNTDREGAEQALRESELRLRLALEATETGLWTWDLIADRVAWSPECYRIHRLPEGAFGGTADAFFALVHPDDRERVRATVRAAIDSGELYECDFRILRPSGAIAWVANRGRARCDESGRPVSMTGTLTDNTERKRIESALIQSEARFHAIVDQAFTGIVLADLSGRILQANDRFCAITGRNRSELLGLHFRDITHPDDVAGNAALFDRVVRNAESFAIEKRYLRPDGWTIWVTSSVTLIRDAEGRPLHCLIVVQDIDDRKRAEAALAEADRRKDEFIAILAHELRNPLAPIRTGVQIMQLSVAAESPGAQVVPMMERQVQHMSRMLDDLLDVSRIGRGKIELRKAPVELTPVIQAAVEASRPLIDQMGHVLALRLPAEPIVLQADPVRLAQVFSNLLNNAAKYMDKGGRIEVDASCEEGEVVVAVRDHGIGIPAGNLSSIFEMFSQVEGALSRSQAGLGIGLSLVKGLLALHGGSVQARSDGPGTGSEFLVRLPASAVQEAGRQDARPTANARSLRILVVDDNADAALSLALLMKMMGNEVRTAYDGAEALAIAAQFAPQVVLLDLGMPRMDGYEVCRRLRERADASAMTVIAVSGWGQEQARNKTRAAGFDEHLVKPVASGDLSRVLARISLPS